MVGGRDVDVPGASGAPCSAGTTSSAVARSRIGASRLRPVGGMCSTTQSAASSSAGSVRTSRRSASTPPADAATPMTRAGRAVAGRMDWNCTLLKSTRLESGWVVTETWTATPDSTRW